jgi:hypothetical protein
VVLKLLIRVLVKRKHLSRCWCLALHALVLHAKSYSRLGTRFSLSAYRACTPADEFGGREPIF